MNPFAGTPWRRYLSAILLGVALVGAGVIRDARLQNARPVDMSVDVGTAGTHDGPLRQSFDEFCYQQYEIQFEPPLGATEAAQFTQQFVGKIVITDAAGKTLREYPSDLWGTTGNVVLPRQFGPHLPVGDYAVRLTVEKPVPLLAGRQQRLVSEYVSCSPLDPGIWQMMLLSLFGFALILYGIGNLGIALVGPRRPRVSSRSHAPSPCAR